MAYLRGKVLYTRDALYVLLLMCPVNSQNEEKLAYYAVSPAHGRGGSQSRRTRRSLLATPTPAPSPTRVVARRTRRKFYYSLRLLLVPTLVREIIILFGIYVL